MYAIISLIIMIAQTLEFYAWSSKPIYCDPKILWGPVKMPSNIQRLYVMCPEPSVAVLKSTVGLIPTASSVPATGLHSLHRSTILISTITL